MRDRWDGWGVCGIGGKDRGYAEIGGTDRGYAEIGGKDRGYAEIGGTDHLPEIGPAGLPFLVPPPPIYEGLRMRTANNQLAEKGMLISCLIC